MINHTRSHREDHTLIDVSEEVARLQDRRRAAAQVDPIDAPGQSMVFTDLPCVTIREIDAGELVYRGLPHRSDEQPWLECRVYLPDMFYELLGDWRDHERYGMALTLMLRDYAADYSGGLIRSFDTIHQRTHIMEIIVSQERTARVAIPPSTHNYANEMLAKAYRTATDRSRSGFPNYSFVTNAGSQWFPNNSRGFTSRNPRAG